jgi:hypothetical protein
MYWFLVRPVLVMIAPLIKALGIWVAWSPSSSEAWEREIVTLTFRKGQPFYSWFIEGEEDDTALWAIYSTFYNMCTLFTIYVGGLVGIGISRIVLVTYQILWSPFKMASFYIDEFIGLIINTHHCVLSGLVWCSRNLRQYTRKQALTFFEVSSSWPSKTKPQVSYWLAQSKIYKTCFIFFLLSYIYLLSCEARNYPTMLITNLIFIMPVYLLWQTFTYFYKTYHISKYTTQVAAFWQRTYLVFWALEISLYLIFVFIWFIGPEAPKMSIGHALNLKTINLSLIAVTDIFCYLLLLLVANIFLLIKKNYQNPLLAAPVLLVVLYLYVSILVDEYRYFLYNSSQWSATVDSLISEGVLTKQGNKISLGSIEERVLLLLENYSAVRFEKANEELVAQMTYSLLWFLRFWHVVLIFMMFAFFTFKWIVGHTISYEALAMNISNVVILIAFNLTYLIFYIKTIGKEHLVVMPKAYGIDDLSNISHYIILELLGILGF